MCSSKRLAISCVLLSYLVLVSDDSIFMSLEMFLPCFLGITSEVLAFVFEGLGEFIGRSFQSWTWGADLLLSSLIDHYCSGLCCIFLSQLSIDLMYLEMYQFLLNFQIYQNMTFEKNPSGLDFSIILCDLAFSLLILLVSRLSLGQFCEKSANFIYS